MDTQNQPALIDNNTGLIIDESADQAAADQSTEEIFGSPENAQKTGKLIANFVGSYSQNKGQQAPEEWLDQAFAQYPDIWANADERQQTAAVIVTTIQRNNEANADLYTHLGKGKSRASWLAKKIEQGAASSGVANVSQYATSIDSALATANNQLQNAVTTQSGNINQNPNLDGFIAEQHHANTFNLDAIAKGSPYRAKVCAPEQGTGYGKNSMDIGIYDDTGKLVRRYQSKYGADAEATAKQFETGDYRGQRKLVPEGHGGANSSEVIEIDGISSKPLSKETAKTMQNQAQQEQDIKQYEWNDTNRMVIAQEIGKKALISAAFSAGFQGTRILGRRLWNNLMGKENPPANEDLQEFFAASLGSAKNVGVQIAVSGALVVAAKNGWISILKNTPAGRIADIAYVGLENAKCLYKLAKGELTAIEALDAMGNASCTAIGGLIGAANAGMVGAAIGTVLGPVGTVLGGFVGSVVGGIAGSTISDALYQGGKAIVKVAHKALEQVGEGLKTVASRFLSLLRFS